MVLVKVLESHSNNHTGAVDKDAKRWLPDDLAVMLVRDGLVEIVSQSTPDNIRPDERIR
jgi:hypothetical protein